MSELTVEKIRKLGDLSDSRICGIPGAGVVYTQNELIEFLLAEIDSIKKQEDDYVCNFVAAYEKRKYEIMSDGGKLLSVNVFMVEYCQNLRK